MVFGSKAKGFLAWATPRLSSYDSHDKTTHFDQHIGHILPNRGKGTEMVAPRKSPRIFCTIVRVPVAEDDRMVIENRLNRRPSDRLPWSDPILAQLVTQLQDEVRGERRQGKLATRAYGAESAELEPTGPDSNQEYDWQNTPRWNWREVDGLSN